MKFIKDKKFGGDRNIYSDDRREELVDS